MGMELSDEMRDMVLSEVIRIGDKKKRITPQDLPFIISDVLKRPSQKLFEITHYDIINRFGEMPRAAIKVRHKGHEHEASAKGDGGYDAFMRALRKILRGVGVKPPKLMDYEVRIPPGGKTDALVETTITWMLSENEAPLVTIGVDSDQIGAAIEATEKMLNLAFRPAAGAGN
jgi:D-citramalate synthase